MYDFDKFKEYIDLISSEKLNNAKERYKALDDEIKELVNQNRRLKYKETHGKYGKNTLSNNFIAEKINNYKFKMDADNKTIERITNRINSTEKKLNNLDRINSRKLSNNEYNYIKSKIKRRKNILNRLNRRKNKLQEYIEGYETRISNLKLELKKLEKSSIIKYENQEEYENDLNIKKQNNEELKIKRKEARDIIKELERKAGIIKLKKNDRSEKNMQNESVPEEKNNDVKLDQEANIRATFEGLDVTLVDELLHSKEYYNERFATSYNAVSNLLQKDKKLSSVFFGYVTTHLKSLKGIIEEHKNRKIRIEEEKDAEEKRLADINALPKNVQELLKQIKNSRSKLARLTDEMKKELAESTRGGLAINYINKWDSGEDIYKLSIDKLIILTHKYEDLEIIAKEKGFITGTKTPPQEPKKEEPDNNLVPPKPPKSQSSIKPNVNQIKSLDSSLYVMDDIDLTRAKIRTIKETTDGYTMICYDLGNNQYYTSIVEFTFNRNNSNHPTSRLENEVINILKKEEERLEKEKKVKVENQKLQTSNKQPSPITNVTQPQVEDEFAGFKNPNLAATTSIETLHDTLKTVQTYFMYKQVVMYLRMSLVEAGRRKDVEMQRIIESKLSQKELDLKTLKKITTRKLEMTNDFAAIWNNSRARKHNDIKPICERSTDLYDRYYNEQRLKYTTDTQKSINSKGVLAIVFQSGKAKMKKGFQKYVEEEKIIPTPEIRSIIEQKLAVQEGLFSLNTDDIYKSRYGESILKEIKNSLYQPEIDEINLEPPVIK